MASFLPPKSGTKSGAQGAEGEQRDVRDRLILALYAQLKAERQTREALEYVIRNGALAPEVLEAIAGDPIPVAAAEDVAAVEKVIALDARRRQAATERHSSSSSKSDPL